MCIVSIPVRVKERKRRSTQRSTQSVSIPVRVKEQMNKKSTIANANSYQSPVRTVSKADCCTFACESGLRNNKILCSFSLYTIILVLSREDFQKNMQIQTCIRGQCEKSFDVSIWFFALTMYIRGKCLISYIFMVQ